MAKKRSPDGRLVYLHCSSIFSGANAQVRRAKKVSQLLEQHKASIKILTKEFTVPAIAAVAKELLEERIFESLPRAKLRYPELFQLTETQEAERAASEAEVVRIEAEAAQDLVLASDDEGGDECLGFEQSGNRAEHVEALEDKAEALVNAQISSAEPCKQSTTRVDQALSIPRLHPVYLPFKTKHRTLVLVQSLLEDICFHFGNTWVPDLMEARKWYEAESIELTEWTKRFSKYAKSLPPSAIKPIAGKSIAEVLFGTSALRHSAVHRDLTSAAGIRNMLDAAIIFAEALNDSAGAAKIVEIKTRLEASIEEIVQHQNLLERKLRDQFEHIARRRAELDELERSSVEEMLTTDKKQRTEVGSAFESFLIGSQQVSSACSCKHTPTFDGAKADSEAEEHIEHSGLEHEPRLGEGMPETEACDQSPLGEEEPLLAEYTEKDTPPSWHDNHGNGVEEDLHVSVSTFPMLKSKGKMKEETKAAAPGWWGIPAAEEAPVIIDEASVVEEASPAPKNSTDNLGWNWPRYQVWNFGATSEAPVQPHTVAEDAVTAEKACYAAPEEESDIDKPYNFLPEEKPIPELTFAAQEAVSNKDSMGTEKLDPDTTLEISQDEVVIEEPEDAEEPPFNQRDDISHGLDDPCGVKSGLDAVLTADAPAEDAESFASPLEPPLDAVSHDVEFHPPPLAPSSTVTSVLEAAAPEVQMEDGHTVTLKIRNGSKLFRSIVLVRACTRKAILEEARVYCMKRAQDDQSLATLLARGYELTLMSLKMYGYDMDLSTYKVENLSSLVRTAEKTGIPRFTLRISEGFEEH
ncbi:MAG: hypothetical protein Q9191_006820 [Dirinaria sp. TL-2023a]